MRILVTLKISNSHFGDIPLGGGGWVAMKVRRLAGELSPKVSKDRSGCHNENCWPQAVENHTQFLRKCHDRDSIRSA